MKDINCPYCDTEQDIDHDDGRGYSEGETHQQECDDCGKTFVFTTSISYYYEPYKADCLNEGGVHDWTPTTTIPREYSRMRCTMCDEERTPTEDEMKEILSKK